MANLRRLLLVVLAAALAAPASATWSIVVLNRRTGEVAVATATCLTGSTLRTRVPLVRVGLGAAATQAQVGTSNTNALIIWNGLAAGLTPHEIIQAIRNVDSDIRFRQFGIVGLAGPPRTFTGVRTGDWSGGVRGFVEDWEYAIQGNVLTGQPVVDEAELAFRTTDGDTITRIMAAMEAARAMGGDGRCSCNITFPDSCGSPPAGGFTHSAWSAHLVLARLGDTDGTCGTSIGCANGDYYLQRDVVGGPSAPDPVVTLAQEVAQWRASLAGVPDHVLSEVRAELDVLPADGATAARVTVRLVDLEGDPLTSGGQTLHVARTGGEAIASVGPVTDHGDGTHSFDVTAGTTPGRATYTITVDDGLHVVQLHPPLVLATLPPSELHLGRASYSAAEGTRVPLLLDRGPSDAGRPYRVLASTSGTSPGTLVFGVTVPLNRDRLFDWTLVATGAPPFEGSAGVLDGAGRAAAALELPPGALTSVVGSTLAFCAVVPGSPGPLTNVTGLLVGP